MNEVKSEIEGDRPQDSCRQRRARGVRPAPVRARADQRPAPRRGLMFSRVLVANRGEIAVRVIRALHELGVEAVAVYSTADKDALHVQMADHAVHIGPPSATESYLRIPSVIAAANTTGCEAVHPGLRLPRREPRVRRGVCRQRARLRRAARGRDGDDGRQDLREAGDARRRRPDRARDRGRDVRRGGARGGGGDRLSVLLKATAGGGGKGMRLVRRRRRARRRVQHGRERSRRGVRRSDDVRREGARSRAPRRDPGDLRPLRQRPDAWRARVLDPAPPPEADRGVAVAGAHARDARGDGGRGGTGVPRGRLPQRRHVRVSPRPGRQLLLHRAERTPAGRAPGDRAVHRDRPRARAAAGRSRRAALASSGGHRGVAMRSRSASTPRIPSTISGRHRDRVALFKPAEGPGVRVDTFIESGTVIPPFYDSMIAKLVVWDTDRAAAIARARACTARDDHRRASRRLATWRSRCSAASRSAAATTRRRRSTRCEPRSLHDRCRVGRRAGRRCSSSTSGTSRARRSARSTRARSIRGRAVSPNRWRSARRSSMRASRAPGRLDGRPPRHG